MSYKHKSGAEKRKLLAEKQKKSAVGRQNITNFFSAACSATQPVFPATTTELEQNEPSTSGLEAQDCAKIDSNTTTGNDNLLDSSSLLNLNDPGEWPDFINDALRQQIVKIGAPNFEELCAYKFPPDLNNQVFSKTLLYSKSTNQREKLPRDWLVWSSVNNSFYCFSCFLFKNSFSGPCNSNLVKKGGFSPSEVPWKKLYTRFPLHEESAMHKNCYVSWKSLEQSLTGKGIDSSIQKQIMCETERWKAILKRIIDVTLHLASRGLPFRGENSHIGDVSNGNFLGCMELISHYDEITRDHLNKIKQDQESENAKKHTHYLSWQSQNEFISLCGDHVLKLILAEREKAIYYAIIADATPDVSHQEQNVLILRYLSFSTEKNLFEIQERFIEFLNFSEKAGFNISEELMACLERHGIPLADCRGQVYDNGSNMKGAVKGVKTRILKENPLALFSPCGAHSLNLIGVNAAKMCPQIMTFFGSVQAVFVLFAGSPSRWSILLEEVPVSLMPLSETRWSSRIDAVRPITEHRPGLLKALDRLSEELSSKLTEKSFSEVQSLKKYFSSFESMVMSAFWFKVLSCIDERNIIIQARGISLDVELSLLDDLQKDLQKLRNEWPAILQETKLVSEAMDIDIEFSNSKKRTRKRKAFFDEREETDNVNDETMHQITELVPGENKFRIEVVFSVLDFIINDINARFEEMTIICTLFRPILTYMSVDDEEVQKRSEYLVSKYKTDLNGQLGNEIILLRKIHSSVFNKTTELSPLALLNEIYDKRLQTIFPNVCVALRIFCTLPLTVAQAERAFSKLGNQFKTWTRAATGQDRLNSLAILGIEHKLAACVDFSSIIHEFATKKARKVKLL